MCPGLSTVADENGFFEYKRPEGKSGGHGVGWSEIPRYSFKVRPFPHVVTQRGLCHAV